MTTDIAGIRERANEYVRDTRELDYVPTGSARHFEIDARVEAAEREFPHDVITLLDANAELAERVRTLEAARPAGHTPWMDAIFAYINDRDPDMLHDAIEHANADALAATDANGESADHGANGGALQERIEDHEVVLWDIANAYGFPRGIEWENDPLFIHSYVQRVIATWVNVQSMRTQDQS